ncbi:hypothetical protein BZA05DRAFT_397248 [Tricharina praecox]|uniref:uncharacterized protein n=1 Tax=Tricharina praecox TaxID=43433 RepID=UPI00221EB149|nr:uncharacterized protein BZA05DRAFT_397248 [Tricharina praecox]KAI5852229.1 hypothetical protein BZA05DRAFT_397248 [Tricharina praecox]
MSFRDTNTADPFSAPPPPGPPPPSLPEGWLAKWDDNYRQYYYVNLYTKKSQWEIPTVAAMGAGGNGMYTAAVDGGRWQVAGS